MSTFTSDQEVLEFFEVFAMEAASSMAAMALKSFKIGLNLGQQGVDEDWMEDDEEIGNYLADALADELGLLE